MPATVRGGVGSANGAGSPGPQVVTKPAGVVDGDYLIAIQVADAFGALASMTAPAGWVLNNSTTSTNGFLKVWTKTAASEGASWSFGAGASADSDVGVVAITAGSYNTTTPLAQVVFGGSTTAATAQVAPTATGVTNGLLLTGVGSFDTTNYATRTYTPPTGMPEVFESSGQRSTAVEGASLALASTAATGTKTATCSASLRYLSVSIVVNPSAVTGPSGTLTAAGAGGATLGGAGATSTALAASGIGAATLGGGAAKPGAYQRGVNSAGADFGTGRNVANGTYDSDASFAFYAARGHKKIRIPFLMEHLMPTLGGTFNATELARLNAAVTSCTSRGMTAVLDPHNYARYTTADGVVHVLGDPDGVFTQALLIDFWTKLSTQFKGASNVEYGLMNEPHDMSTAPSLTGPELVTNPGFETNTTGWTGTNATLARDTTVFKTGVASLKVTSSTTTDAQVKMSTVAVTGGATYVAGYDVRGTATSTGKNSYVGIDWFNGATYLSSTYTDYAVLVSGTWQQHRVQVTAPAGATAASMVHGFQATVASQVINIDNVTFIAGTMLTGAQRWEAAAQALVAAIRGNGDTTWVWVPGYNYSGVQSWWTVHPTWWITDSANKSGPEGHYYFDSDNSGNYANGYASDNSDAITRGYASLTARARAEFNSFAAGCASNNLKGFVGELGWPNTDASYNTVGDAVYVIADSSNLDVTYWAAGEQWGTTYLLSIYTGTPQATATSVAATVEAHPTSTAAIVALTAAGTGSATLGGSLTGSGGFTVAGGSAATLAGPVTEAATLTPTAVGGATVGGFRTQTGTLTADGVGSATVTGGSALTSLGVGSATVGGTRSTSSTLAAAVTGGATLAGFRGQFASLTAAGAGSAALTAVVVRSSPLTAAGAGSATVTGFRGKSATLTAAGYGTTTLLGIVMPPPLHVPVAATLTPVLGTATLAPVGYAATVTPLLGTATLQII